MEILICTLRVRYYSLHLLSYCYLYFVVSKALSIVNFSLLISKFPTPKLQVTRDLGPFNFDFRVWWDSFFVKVWIDPDERCLSKFESKWKSKLPLHHSFCLDPENKSLQHVSSHQESTGFFLHTPFARARTSILFRR